MSRFTIKATCIADHALFENNGLLMRLDTFHKTKNSREYFKDVNTISVRFYCMHLQVFQYRKW